MEKFKILEHTADLKIKAFGKDKKEVFENVMLGMFKGARYEAVGESSVVKREIKVSSHDLPSLLVDFLSEVLYLSEVNQEIYQQIKFKIFNDPLISSGQAKIEAALIGKKLKSRGVIIKGATYHDLDIHQLKDKTWQATILFDI